MTDFQKQFEANGYASWINSELYPDGQIYTKEYTQWLEKQLETKKQANPEIIAAIAAYLEKNCNGYGEFIHFKDYPECWDVHVATEIAAAIAPLVEAGEPDWKDAPEWAEWRTVDKNMNVTFWEEEPLIVQSRGFWRQGNDGGQWEEQKYNNDWEESLQRRPQ